MINAKTRPMVRAKQTRTGEGYTKSFNCTYKDLLLKIKHEKKYSNLLRFDKAGGWYKGLLSLPAF